MKYFFDTEFLEGKQIERVFSIRSKVFFNIIDSLAALMALFIFFYISMLIGSVILLITIIFWQRKDVMTSKTIDLISIGIVAEDGRELYRVSSDFNLKEAWYRYDLKINRQHPLGPEYYKQYWIRENVLRPIFNEFSTKYIESSRRLNLSKNFDGEFTYKNLRTLLKVYGVSNEQIAKEIESFTDTGNYSTILSGEDRDTCSVIKYQFDCDDVQEFRDNHPDHIEILAGDIKFYAYYADYDWVVFCWLFGRMIDLPKGYPMYCIDLKQQLVEKWVPTTYYEKPADRPDYPKNTDEHNALADAKWNKELSKFICNL